MTLPAPRGWAVNLLLALVPLLLVALVTIGWQNSHAITRLSTRVELLDRDVVNLRELLEGKH